MYKFYIRKAEKLYVTLVFLQQLSLMYSRSLESPDDEIISTQKTMFLSLLIVRKIFFSTIYIA